MSHSGFRIIDENEALPQKPTCIVLYGMPGVSKTSCAFTMPRPVLLIDSDQGVRRAVQKLRPKTVAIEKYGPFFDYLMSVAFEDYVRQVGFKTVVIDTVGTLLDDLVAPFLLQQDPKNGNGSGGLGLPGYGALKTNFALVKARFQQLGLEICLVCHAKEEGDSRSKRFDLAVTGGSADVIMRSADLIGYVSITGDRRTINFNPTNWNIGKNVGNLPEFIVPNFATPDYDGFMAGIVEQVKAEMLRESTAQTEFNAALAQWEETLEACKSPGDMGGFMVSAGKLPEGLLRASVRTMFQARMEALGFVFDAETKTVTDPSAKAKKPKKGDADPEAEEEPEVEPEPAEQQ